MKRTGVLEVVIGAPVGCHERMDVIEAPRGAVVERLRERGEPVAYALLAEAPELGRVDRRDDTVPVVALRAAALEHRVEIPPAPSGRVEQRAVAVRAANERLALHLILHRVPPLGCRRAAATV